MYSNIHSNEVAATDGVLDFARMITSEKTIDYKTLTGFTAAGEEELKAEMGPVGKEGSVAVPDLVKDKASYLGYITADNNGKSGKVDLEKYYTVEDNSISVKDRVRLGPLGKGEPLRHARLGVGDDQIGHITARGGLAHGELFNIQAVLHAARRDRVELLVDLPHGVEVFIRRNFDAHGAEILAVNFGRQVKVAAKVDVVAAVRMGHAVVGRCLAGSAVGGIEVVVHMEGDIEHGLAVFLVRRQLDVRELMLVLALGHPAVEISAREGIGEELFVDVGAGIVALQRELDRSRGDRRVKRFFVHAGNGDGEGNVLALLARNERDGGIHIELGAKERIVPGIHVLMADGECGGDRKRERQHQRQQERQGLCCIRMLRHNSSSYMVFPPRRSPAERMCIV